MSLRTRAVVLLSALALLVMGVGLNQAGATTEPEHAVTAHGVVMLDPCRVADSRTWVTLTTFNAYQSENLTVTGHCGVPADAAGVILNVTVVPQEGGMFWNPGGYLTVFPKGGAQPEVSQVSYNWNNTSTEVTARLSSDGALTIFNGAPGNADVIVDVAAYITA